MAGEVTVPTPEVTVLMPVYNGRRFICAAIESVLDQSFDDFELLVIDDGSRDDSLAIAQDYADKDARIRVLSRENRGIVETLNEGIDAARGQWLARLDCDDISLPDRLAVQTTFLRDHPDYVFCASDAYIINQYGCRLRSWPDLGHSHEELCASLRFTAAFPHSSVCFNLSLLRKYGLYYRSEYPHAEDFDLWQRIVGDYPCCVVRQPLLEWRSHSTSVNYRHRMQQLRQTTRIVEEHFRALNKDMREGFLHHFLDERNGISNRDCARLQEIFLKTFESIDAEPQATRYFSRKAFSILLSRIFVDFGCLRGFDDTNRVFGCVPLKKLLARRARLLFFLSQAFSSQWVMRFDYLASYVHVKFTNISSRFRRGN